MKYKVKENKFLTLCPLKNNKKNLFYVGGASCFLCRYFLSVDDISKIVECKKERREKMKKLKQLIKEVNS